MANWQIIWRTVSTGMDRCIFGFLELLEDVCRCITQNKRYWYDCFYLFEKIKNVKNKNYYCDLTAKFMQLKGEHHNYTAVVHLFAQGLFYYTRLQK